jgi:hypothetical protein
MRRVVGYARRRLAQGGPGDDNEQSKWRHSLMNSGAPSVDRRLNERRRPAREPPAGPLRPRPARAIALATAAQVPLRRRADKRHMALVPETPAACRTPAGSFASDTSAHDASRPSRRAGSLAAPLTRLNAHRELRDWDRWRKEPLDME